MLKQTIAVLLIPGLCFASSVCSAQDDLPLANVLADGESIAELPELRSLNSYFPFEPPATAEIWNAHANHWRNYLRLVLGLWPEPTRTPLNAVIHGKIDQGDYTVEKVYFEAMPGFFVTGNLYRPKEFEGKIPGVLSPHGHYSNGRFHEVSADNIKATIETGAEEFPTNARSPLQARCAHLARMGCTVFHYDMIGYADSQQIPNSIAHGFRTQREHMNGPGGWGFFSPRAESHMQSIMGLQTWSSIRALDFLESLDEVDKDRLAVTGSSGGGTQTFILCAIDPRPVASFPAVMVSTAMQGGCTCENCSYLRINLGNVDIAALFAPKPMGLTAADDWTREMETKGFPQLKALYAMLGKPDNVELTSRTEFPHNYNQVSREAMYRLFDKHLGLNGLVEEQPMEFLSRKQLSVWNEEHPSPPSGEEFEKGLLKYWKTDSRSKMTSKEGVQRWADGRDQLRLLLASKSRHELVQKLPDIRLEDGIQIKKGLFKIDDRYSAIVQLYGRRWTPGHRTVYLVSSQGKQSLFSEDGKSINEDIKRLLNEGYAVFGFDPYMTGEVIPESGKPEPLNRIVENGRQAPAYTYGYNRPVFVQRVMDCINYELPGMRSAGPAIVVALDEYAPVAIVAASQDHCEQLIVNTNGFRFADVNDYRDANFFPGSARLGDIPGFLDMTQPRRMLLFGETAEQLAESPFFDGDSIQELQCVKNADEEEMLRMAVDFILKN